MKMIAVGLLFVLTLSPAVVQQGLPVIYSGGSLAVKSGQALRLVLAGNLIQLFDAKGGDPLLALNPRSVTEISYGQEAHHRVGAAIATVLVAPRIAILLAMSQTKKHYIGILWANSSGNGGVVVQADKNEFRGILAALSGMTGRGVINADARRSYGVDMAPPPEANTAAAVTATSAATPATDSLALQVVTVTSVPSDALIEVDRYPAGRTPAEVKLQPGEYTVKVSKSGFQSYSQKIVVEAGKGQTVGVALAGSPKSDLGK